MLTWLMENAAVVANLASLLMLIVWAFYAVLFYREFKRQRSPFIVIHQAKGYDLDSTCLVVNLSREPIHILCVMLILHTTRGSFAQRIHNFRRGPRPREGSPDMQTIFKQGPLASGSFLVLGSFEEMLVVAIDDILAETGTTRIEEWDPYEWAGDIEQLEVRVVALHGAHDRPVGAYRTFDVTVRDDVSICPAMLLTEQMASRSRSRRVEQWLRACLPE
jgi:hypothetical protein